MEAKGAERKYRLCSTARLGILLEKLIVSHLVKKFPSDWARG
jgi:hypothetical protein